MCIDTFMSPSARSTPFVYLYLTAFPNACKIKYCVSHRDFFFIPLMNSLLEVDDDIIFSNRIRSQTFASEKERRR